jgi:hypothetical protein
LEKLTEFHFTQRLTYLVPLNGIRKFIAAITISYHLPSSWPTECSWHPGTHFRRDEHSCISLLPRACYITGPSQPPRFEHTNNIFGSTDFEAPIFFILLLLAIINLNILLENFFSNCTDLIYLLIMKWQDIPWPYVNIPVTYPSGHSKSDVSYEHG